MDKKKILFILHYSPPIHGASKVGDTIVNSQLIRESFKSRFVKIKSSNNLGEIGTFKLNKIWHVIALFFKVSYQLMFFRPEAIYFTASPYGFAFYRDLVISIPIKVYKSTNSKCEIFYHYHATGILEFTGSSKLKKTLTNFFVKNISLIFISDLMKKEVQLLNSYKSLKFLNNGVPNLLSDKEFQQALKERNQTNTVNVLFLSNMMKDKGYRNVLGLAKKTIDKGIENLIFHFAGSWASKEDEIYFKEFIKKNSLEDKIQYHGLVQGEDKKKLFKNSNVFIFPTQYKKEVFPLSILEALSYGLPVIAFNKGAIKEIIKEENGIISAQESFLKDFTYVIKEKLNTKMYVSCRTSFLRNYTNDIFEKKLVNILNLKKFEDS